MEYEVIKADSLLSFYTGFLQLYGNLAVTPNMHSTCHLKDMLIDFGPVHAFWLSSFERYNGEMAANMTSNCSVGVQDMRKFHTAAHVHPMTGNVPSVYRDEFEELFYCHQSKDHQVQYIHQPLKLYFYS